MSEKIRETSLDMRMEKETMDTADPYKAITAVAEGKRVIFTYNEHHGCFVTFEPDGRVIVHDQEAPEYKHKIGNNDSSAMDAYISNMRQAIEAVKKAKIAVPVGNIENFGGMEKIAKTIMDASLVDDYIRGYEEMTPAEQENFRNTMSDKRKKK